MKQLKIALCMIARNKEDIITRALDSTQGVFDIYVLQDTGSTDNTVGVFEAWCKKNKKKYKISKKFIGKDYKEILVDGNPTLGDFATPRNDSFAMARKLKADYAMWLDTDDIIDNPQVIRPICENMKSNGIHFALLQYVYAQDKQSGLDPVNQVRERIIDLSVPGSWKKRVHETYQFDEGVQIKGQMFGDLRILHERTSEEAANTSRRNNLILQDILKEEGIDKMDVESLHNLAYDHWEHKEYKEAIKYYRAVLKRLNNNVAIDLAYQISLKMGYAYQGLGEIEKAIVECFRASKMNPNMAEPYVLLGELYLSMNKWEDAYISGERILKLGRPNTTAPINEADYVIAPRRLMVYALINMGRAQEALKVMEEILSIVDNPQVRSERFNLVRDVQRGQAIQGLASLINLYRGMNKAHWLDRLMAGVIPELREDQNIRSIIKEIQVDKRQKTSGIKLKAEKSIAIYAGQGYEKWDGNSDKNKGIGGSEGMCIQMSRALAKLGNKVFVFGDPEKPGEMIDGVVYEHHSKWSAKMKSDIFISLRRPDIFNQRIDATKHYLWLHDTSYGNLPTQLFYLPRKVFALSEAHRDVLKENHGITDDSIFYMTRNAYNQTALEYADSQKVERDPYQIIYASSYDRGLENLLTMWPKIKEAIPEATAKIFYGWDTYDEMMKMRAGTQQAQQMMQYKQKIIQMIADSDGVQELGRVSQNDLYLEFGKSSIWWYPTSFFEISCINAMSAQAMGAIPVCSNYAALNETVNGKYGMKLPIEKQADAIIHLLKNQEVLEAKREPMMEWARKEYDITPLSREWNEIFEND